MRICGILHFLPNSIFLMRPELILFDLDGTLVDSAPDLAAAANALRTARGLDPVDPEALRPVASRGSAALVDAVLGISDEALRQEFLANYAAGCANLTRPYPGVRAMLEKLRAEGLTLAVVTNKPVALAGRVLEGLELMPLLSGFWGSDSPGSAMKPYPAGIRLAMRTLGTDDALYVGDEPTDAKAAAAAGIPAALVRWGYAKTPLDAAQARILAGDPAELAAEILAL